MFVAQTISLLSLYSTIFQSAFVWLSLFDFLELHQYKLDAEVKMEYALIERIFNEHCNECNVYVYAGVRLKDAVELIYLLILRIFQTTENIALHFSTFRLFLLFFCRAYE